MKRILTLLVLVVFFGTASAEEIDVASMTTDELYTAADAIELELASREEKGSIIASGLYTAGTDIRVGTWSLRCIAGSGISGVNCMIFDKIESYQEYNKALNSSDPQTARSAISYCSYRNPINAGESCFISLKQGDILVLESVRNALCIIEESKNSFAP